VPSVLLIEDDASIRVTLTRALSGLGHTVASASAGLGGLQHALDERPDIVLLDLGLPDLDGVEVLRMLRAVSAVPVVVVTARDAEGSVVDALNAGADDYLVKPFGAAQLDARIRAVLRRAASGERQGPLKVGPLVVDVRTRTVTLDGAPVELTPKLFELLAVLASRPGEVVTKRELLAEVWNMPYGGADKTVDVHLSWLRRKLGESADSPRLLRTVRGVGVRLVDPAAEVDGGGA
jgi:DNA-binding response OmpR family regulator